MAGLGWLLCAVSVLAGGLNKDSILTPPLTPLEADNQTSPCFRIYSPNETVQTDVLNKLLNFLECETITDLVEYVPDEESSEG